MYLIKMFMTETDVAADLQEIEQCWLILLGPVQYLHHLMVVYFQIYS